jgi:hypothetical protein
MLSKTELVELIDYFKNLIIVYERSGETYYYHKLQSNADYETYFKKINKLIAFAVEFNEGEKPND